jgi:hypothetical protein
MRMSNAGSSAMSVRQARLTAFVMAMVLGQFLYLRVDEARTNYWLRTDASKTTAIVMGELWSGHGRVRYRYSVGHGEYTGKSSRDWKDPKFSSVKVGQEARVYYSSSHPWLSQLYLPERVLTVEPVTFIVIALEFFFVVTLINPTSRWAFRFVEKKEKPPA